MSGNGGSIVTTGSTGGAGGGGFGGNGGDVTRSFSILNGGGGGGGGGLGSRATIGILTNLGNGGSDTDQGLDGNGYGLTITAGSGGGGNSGGSNAGGGGGGSGPLDAGGGGGGSAGSNGIIAQGQIPPLRKTVQYSTIPSGGNGGDGAGGGGGIVIVSSTNQIDGQAGSGGYGGGGGGGAGTGAYDIDFSVQAGSGGLGGGGGGGGVNQSGITSAQGGNSLGGGGGGGGGPSSGIMALGGIDQGNLGGGAGGIGANDTGNGFGGGGGGGGGGGSALGAAIFIDSNLNLTIQASSGIPSVFNTPNNTTQAGDYGNGGLGGANGTNGSALGESIFLRSGSSLTFHAENANDILTLGDQVAFVDDTLFGAGGTSVFVKGNGSVIYQGTTDYQGTVTVNNANFKVNGRIDQAPVFVCRNQSFSNQRGTLSGKGTLTGNVFANSGTISPDIGETLTLGSLTLNSATIGSLGSLTEIAINAGGTSLIAVNGSASLAGTLNIHLDSMAQPGQYTLLTSTGITGAFDAITFSGSTPNYTLSYLPQGAPTYVQFNFLGYPSSSVDIPATVNGSPILNPAVVCCGRPILLGPLPIPGAGATTYHIANQTGNITCQIGQTNHQTYLKIHGKNGSCTITATKEGVVSNPLKVIVP